MHDIPYSFSVGPEVVACMTAVCTAVRSICPSLTRSANTVCSGHSSGFRFSLYIITVVLYMRLQSSAAKAFRAEQNRDFQSCVGQRVTDFSSKHYIIWFYCPITLSNFVFGIYVTVTVCHRSGFHQGQGFCLFSRGWWGPPECLRWGLTEISQTNWSWACADLHRHQKEAQVRSRLYSLNNKYNLLSKKDLKAYLTLYISEYNCSS